MASSRDPELVEPLTGQPAPTTGNIPAPTPTPAGGGVVVSEDQIKLGPGDKATPNTPNVPAAPSAALGSGTGFVNIDRVLGANGGAGGAVLGAARKAGDQRFAEFGGAKDSFRGRQRDAANNSSLAVGSVGNNIQIDQGLVGGKLGNAIKTFDFSETFAPGWNSETTKRLDALGNTRSAGRQMATDAGLAPEYNTKLSSIDAAIYGNDSWNMDQAKGVGTSLRYGEDADTGIINQDTKSMRDDSAQLAAGNNAALRGVVGNYEQGSTQGNALAAILGDPDLKFGTPGAVAPTGVNAPARLGGPLVAAASPPLLAAPQQQYGEGAGWKERPTNRTRLV